MNPYDLAYQLSKALQGSTQFANFKQAQDKIKSDSTAREMLVDFRRQQLLLHQQMLAGLEVAPEQEEKLEKLHAIINMNSYIKEFLESEYNLSVLMRDVEKIIADSLADLVDTELFAAALPNSMGEEEEELE